MVVYKNTKDVSSLFIKVLVYGAAGAGKTRLCGTTGEKTLIISAEAGLLSLRSQDIDYVEVSGMSDLTAVYNDLAGGNHPFKWVCLDSISEIAEVVLADAKATNKDGRKAYMDMGDTMVSMIRAFRDLPMNVYMSAKMDKVKDEISGGIMFGPSTPGQKVAAALPYYFDECLVLHSWKETDPETQKSFIERRFQTHADAQYVAKDRSGCLDFVEIADLGHIRSKIIGASSNAVDSK